MRALSLGAVLCLLLSSLLAPALAQSQTDQNSGQQQQKPSETAPPEAGGPQGDIGPIAVPKKKEEPPPPPPPSAPKKIPGMPDYSIQVNVPLVTLDVMALTKEGQFIPGLKEGNFQVYENGVEQKISSFSQSQAPITAVLLVEFAATNYSFMYDALNASYYFANSLKPQDWVAVVSYDMRPYILVDFTQDKRAIFGALNQLRIPGFSETNLFDALYDTLDRLDRLPGRKAIVLVSTGRDTFSKLTLDQIMQKIKATKDVTIFPISIGFMWREYVESHYGMNPDVSAAMMDYLQADNQMRTFAKLTGGKAYFPRFEGEFPDVYRDIGNALRNQYTLAYHPTDPKLDGTYRKLKVDLVGQDGKPLKIHNQKGKEVKYQLVYRDGYTAKHQVE
ncbi:MAG TPA: VWA domain-containing protein [Terriglobales bacterium]|jgi:VWFA-related protein|nr:VWA domain-containing protein [Terriglobales bacterium]